MSKMIGRASTAAFQLVGRGVGSSKFVYPPSHPSSAPLLLGLHATGLCKETMRPMFNELAGILPFPVAEALLIDLTGHGGTPVRPLADDDRNSWNFTVDDTRSVLTELRLDTPKRAVIAIGHSMGGASAILHELKYPGTFSAMVLFEPVLGPMPTGGPNPLAEGARRRRAKWANMAAAEAYFLGKPMYSSWRSDALEGFFNGGLVKLPTGEVELACEPAFEASLYSPTHNAFARLAEVRCPVTIVAGDMPSIMTDFGISVASYETRAKQLQRGRVAVVAGAGHFLVQEKPVECAAVIADALQRVESSAAESAKL